MRRITMLAGVVAASVALWIGVGLLFVKPWLGIGVLLGTVAVLVRWAKADNRRHNPAPTAPEWHVIDEELPDELSATELEMERANRTITALRWPNEWRAGLTEAQRQLAAEHAAQKRYFDGLGDQ